VKRRSSEQLSGETSDEEDEQFQITRCLVCPFFFNYLGKKQRHFG
jgi:hypothetical protein